MNQKPIPAPRIPEHTDVFGIRARTRYRSSLFRLTQEDFARSIGVAPGTICQWEQGRKKPSGAARVLLALLDKDPDLVTRLLGK